MRPKPIEFRCEVLNGMQRPAEAAVCYDTLVKTSSGDRARLQTGTAGPRPQSDVVGEPDCG